MHLQIYACRLWYLMHLQIYAWRLSYLTDLFNLLADKAGSVHFPKQGNLRGEQGEEATS